MPSRPVELVFSNSLSLYEIVVLRAFAFLVEFENSWLLFKTCSGRSEIGNIWK